MATRVYALALALLLGVASTSQAGEPRYYSPTLETKACEKATPGARLYHVRYAATFLVVTVDPKMGRAMGTFPGTPHGTAVVPVRCVDLVAL